VVQDVPVTSGSDASAGEAWPAWRCPQHGTVLDDHGDELVCGRGDRFAVRDGIPRFVRGETYADAFGVQWKQYRQTQLDSYTGVPITRGRTRRCVGEQLWGMLADRHVLECGCGAGRFTEVLLERGARVTSVDLSDAVEANAENFPPDSHHRVAMADIDRLPFAPQQFDVVFCLGVIQHTQDSEGAIAALFEQVRPGGWLVIDHYAPNWRRYTRTAPLVRLLFRHLEPARGLRATERLVDLLLPLHRRAQGHRVAAVLLNRVSPLATYYVAFPELSDELQREWALLDTHDYLTDHYRRHRSADQVRAALVAVGAIDIWCERGGNGVEARARRPEQEPATTAV
jgi:SAM-dependent methyltransferase